MPLTNAGRDWIAGAIIANPAAGDMFDNSEGYIGAGNGDVAFDATHTTLQAVTGTANQLRKGMEPTYPQVAANVLTFRSLFATSEANFTWHEWGVFNDGVEDAGTMLSRKHEVTDLGTKTSAQSWQITVTLTVNAA